MKDVGESWRSEEASADNVDSSYPVAHPVVSTSKPSTTSVDSPLLVTNDGAQQGTTSRAADTATPSDSRRIEAMKRTLSDRDRAVLQSIAEHRFLTNRHVQLLHLTTHAPVSGERIARRVLAKLRKLGLVGTMDRRIGGIRAGSAGLVHFLTDAGHRLLEGRRRHRVQDPTDRFVEHWLAIADARCELVVANSRGVIGSVESAVEPASWRRYQGHGGALTTLKPDLYCETATDQDFVHAWFIEVDLATESIPTLMRKCREYEAYRRSGTEQDRHGAYPLVVWTVAHRDPAKAEQRRQALRAAIDTDGNLPRLLFRVIDPQQLIATLRAGGQQ